MVRKLFVDMLLKADFHLFSKVAYNIGYIDALREIAHIVNDSKYPEYLEEDIVEFLNNKGVKV